MKSMRVALCFLDDDNNVLVSGDDFYCEWTTDMELMIKEKLNLDMQSELAQCIVEELRKQITKSSILDMLKQIKDINRDD